MFFILNFNRILLYMKLLELFSGSQSIGKVASGLGYEVVSVDICDYNGRYKPTHKVDIMNWDYKIYPKNSFDVVWASPPCVFYSALQKPNYGRRLKRLNNEVFTKEIHEQNMKESDIIVKKSLEIINYFNPRLWFIENPQTGQLKNREQMKDVPFHDVTYCKYSDWGYKKATRIWTNNTTFVPKFCKKDCALFQHDNNKHLCDVSRIMGADRYLLRSKIPPILINELLT